MWKQEFTFGSPNSLCGILGLETGFLWVYNINFIIFLILYFKHVEVSDKIFFFSKSVYLLDDKLGALQRLSKWSETLGSE